MGVIRFVDNEMFDQMSETSVPVIGTVKFCLKKNLAQSEERDIIIYTTDTQEFYHGNGLGSPLSRMSDVLMFNNRGEFPEVGISDKFYVDKSGDTFFYWNGSAYVQISADETGEVIVQELNKIYETSIFTGYRQKVIISDLVKLPVKLDYVPAKGAIKLEVNGVIYDATAFSYDQSTNMIDWLFTRANGGFDLQNEFEVTIAYDFLYSDNNIVDHHDFIKTHRKRIIV